MDMSQNIRERLWEARQQLYRLYDMESISLWKARDLLILNELFEEYDLLTILSKEREDSLKELHAIKDRINEEISKTNTITKDYKAKSILAKKLDKVLTLIALVEVDNREGISRLIATYNLLNRSDKQLLKALQNYAYSDKEEREREREGEGEYRSTVNKIKEEL
ncbi:MAG: hypothetical protein QW560_05965, partial [Candidatus Nitrosocaldus sp.]